MALMALVDLTAMQRTAGGVAAMRANETAGPAQTIQRLLALCFAAILRQEVLEAEAPLELDRVFRHLDFPRVFRQFHYSGLTGSRAEP